MIDEELRRLERRWKETGDPEASLRLARSRARIGNYFWRGRVKGVKLFAVLIRIHGRPMRRKELLYEVLRGNGYTDEEINKTEDEKRYRWDDEARQYRVVGVRKRRTMSSHLSVTFTRLNQGRHSKADCFVKPEVGIYGLNADGETWADELIAKLHEEGHGP